MPDITTSITIEKALEIMKQYKPTRVINKEGYITATYLVTEDDFDWEFHVQEYPDGSLVFETDMVKCYMVEK